MPHIDPSPASNSATQTRTSGSDDLTIVCNEGIASTVGITCTPNSQLCQLPSLTSSSIDTNTCRFQYLKQKEYCSVNCKGRLVNVYTGKIDTPFYCDPQAGLSPPAAPTCGFPSM